jgi:hypothetical protein
LRKYLASASGNQVLVFCACGAMVGADTLSALLQSLVQFFWQLALAAGLAGDYYPL